MKNKYTATAPNGNTISVTSTRPIKNCHMAINRETGTIGSVRWTINDNKLAKASAASCGYRLGYWKGFSYDRAMQKAQNDQADACKAELDAKYTYIIVPAVAA